MTKTFKLGANVLIAIWLPLLILGLWWWAARDGAHIFYPPLEQILSSLWNDWILSGLRTDLAPSLFNLGVGLVLALVAGIAVGALVGSSDLLWESVRPLVDVGRTTPFIVLIPAVIGIFGVGSTGKIFLIAASCFWPILVNTIDGVRSTPLGWREMGWAYRLSRWEQLSIRVIGAGPQIVVGVRLALAVGLSMVVGSELFASTNGIGHILIESQASFQIPKMWATIVLICLLGLIMSLALQLLEHRVLRWHHEMRASASGGQQARRA